MINLEAYSGKKDELQQRTGRAIEIVGKEAEGNVIVVSHGDMVTVMLGNVVEGKFSTERDCVIHPEPAALRISQG